MAGELISQLPSWEPIERLSAIVVRRRVASVFHATRLVGPSDHIGTVVTLVQRPVEEAVGPNGSLHVISGASLVASCAAPHDDAIVDARVRWWTAGGRRFLDLPSMGIRLSVQSGSARSWPGVGSPEHRRLVRVRRVVIEEVIDAESTSGRHPIGETTRSWRALHGTHLGLLTNWPVRAGRPSPEHGRRRSVPRLAVGPPDAVCRAPWSARGPLPESEPISR